MAVIGVDAAELNRVLKAAQNGLYDGLRQYLKDTDTTTLNVNHMVSSNGVNLKHIARALQGTAVEQLTISRGVALDDAACALLAKNLEKTSVQSLTVNSSVSAKGVAAMLKNLRDSQVRDLSVQIDYTKDKASILEIANSFKGTQIVNFYLDGYIFSEGQNLINAKVLENRRVLYTNPYYLSTLKYLPKAEKAKHIYLSEAEQHDPLRYGAGIVANLPSALASHVMAYLPLMQTQVATKNKVKVYNELAFEKHGHGLEIEKPGCFTMLLRKVFG